MWLGFTAGMFLPGMNKQFDLKIAFMELGRHLARGEGWYQHRRLARILFVLLLGDAPADAAFTVTPR